MVFPPMGQFVIEIKVKGDGQEQDPNDGHNITKYNCQGTESNIVFAAIHKELIRT
jgi:hypothetical protein